MIWSRLDGSEPAVTRISPFRLRLTIYFTLFLILFVSLVYGWDALLLSVCTDRLSRIDPLVSIETASLSYGVLLLEGIDMPSRGISLEGMLVYWHGGSFSPAADSVLVLGGSVDGSIEGEATEYSSGERQSIPPVSFRGLRAVHPSLGEFIADGHLSGIESGDSVNLLVSCGWGDAIASVYLLEGADSLDVNWFRCLTGEGGLPGLPELLDGYSVAGDLHGMLGDDYAFDGLVQELNGKKARMAFSIRRGPDAPMISLSVELSTMTESLSEAIRTIASADYVSLVPSGTMQVRFEGGDTLDIDVSARLDSLVILSSRLSEDTVTFGASVDFRGTVLHGAGELAVDSGRISIGSADVNFSLQALYGEEEPWLSLRLWADSLAGEDITSSVPEGILGRLEGLRLGGWSSFDLMIELDWAEPDSCDFGVDVDVSRLTVAYSPVSIGLFREGGSRIMHDSWGNSRMLSLIPEDSTFTPFDSLHPSLEGLLRCAEDATFRSHSGFCEYHVRNSIRANIESGAFVRGGSTISMQLARNLLLDRDKNLARKVQEVFLTWRLERYLSKDRILEIYARIVELGPDIFGFQEAAFYYFGADLDRLTTRQVAYLVSILPGPKLYYRFYAQDRIPAYWEDYIDRLLTISSDRGWIEHDSAIAALADSIVFVHPPGLSRSQSPPL